MKKSKDKLSVAIIGTGMIAGGFDQYKVKEFDGVYSHAGAFKKDGRFILKTVFDVDRQKAMGFRKHWQVESRANNIEDIYSQFHDVISVCTPDDTHCDIVRAIIKNRCCKTIFVEKPVAQELKQIKEIIRASHEQGVHVVVNFQRNFDRTYTDIRHKYYSDPKSLLAANAYYIKGLSHIGVTMIDALMAVCGYPQQVLAFNRIWNKEIEEYTYEFVLFYDNFNITVKTIDSNTHKYNYHIFEIDFLFSDERTILNANTRRIEKRQIADYVYSGVKVLNDDCPVFQKTEYDTSLLKTVEYIYQVTCAGLKHAINTPELSYNDALIIDKIIASYEKSKKIKIKEEEFIK